MTDQAVLKVSLERLGFSSLEEARSKDLDLHDIIPVTHAATKEAYPEMSFQERKEISKKVAKAIGSSWG